eukprot:scaffold4.g4632.t1
MHELQLRQISQAAQQPQLPLVAGELEAMRQAMEQQAAGREPQPAIDGSLGAVTMQALLQSQKSSSAWIGRLVQAARPLDSAAPPSAPPGGWLAGAHSESVAALQAGGSIAAPAAPFKLERHPPGRREVFVLSKWLEVETQRFNETYGHKDPRTPLVDFLVLAASKAKSLYTTAYQELARQVRLQLQESDAAAEKESNDAYKARLIWESAMRGKQPWDRSGQVELQDEVARLRAELTAALATGPGGSHIDVMSVVMGGAAPGSSPGKHGGSIVGGQAMGGDARPSLAVGGRNVCFRDSQGVARDSRLESMMRPGMGAARRGTTAVEELRRNSQKASMAMGAVLRHLQDSGLNSIEDVEALQAHNANLNAALEAAREELFDVYKQLAELESAAEEMVLLESRVEAAENERDEAAGRLHGMTPRPSLDAHGLLGGHVDDQAVGRFLAALEEHKFWSAEELAGLLVGTEARQGWHLAEHKQLGLGCLRTALAQGTLSREALVQALGEGDAMPLMEHLQDEEEARHWLAELLAEPLAPAALEGVADFLGGATLSGLMLSPSFYGSLAEVQGMTCEAARAAIQRVRMSTKTRVAALETECTGLRKETDELREAVRVYRDIEAKREAARKRRDEEAVLERRNPLQQYIDLLSSQQEAAWKEFLIGMGQGADVPKLFRHAGKIRNKNLSKRETEKMVKEMWKERMADPAAAAGKAGELVDFVCAHLQKKVGIMTAVVEVGQEGGKTVQRFDELMQAMDEDQDGDCVEWKKVFEEDREYNQGGWQGPAGEACGLRPSGATATTGLLQLAPHCGTGLRAGEFAEAIRDQFLQERMEYFKALEEAIYEEANHEEQCGKVHVVRALLVIDHDVTEKAANALANGIFGPEIDTLSVKAVMKKLSRGIIRRDTRLSTANGSRAASVMGKAKMFGKPSKKAANSNEAILRALEAVRQEWVAKELQQLPPT